ncbi:hypothetical protein PoB_000173000 [Plakobranchus ocellatus]|uniref:Uncharacterized protein n=1 Tax=Plakobranchus ocellatus TaxID=259542 RepID=A0AAV3XX64_9GAST|nr:hypothetical protein PoB_000173000 [Plakobranchus ocellatus]
MTARGLLYHVQNEHAMAICLKKGPLIISEKRLLWSPGPEPISCSSSRQTHEDRSTQNVKDSSPCGTDGSSRACPADYRATRDGHDAGHIQGDNQVSRPRESVPMTLNRENQMDKNKKQAEEEGEGKVEDVVEISDWDEHSADDESENEPKDLSRRNSSRKLESLR